MSRFPFLGNVEKHDSISHVFLIVWSIKNRAGKLQIGPVDASWAWTEPSKERNHQEKTLLMNRNTRQKISAAFSAAEEWKYTVRFLDISNNVLRSKKKGGNLWNRQFKFGNLRLKNPKLLKFLTRCNCRRVFHSALLKLAINFLLANLAARTIMSVRVCVYVCVLCVCVCVCVCLCVFQLLLLQQGKYGQSAKNSAWPIPNFGPIWRSTQSYLPVAVDQFVLIKKRPPPLTR